MTAQTNNFELLNEVKTIEDVKTLDSSLDLLIEALYKPKKEFEKILESEISNKLAFLLRKTFDSDSENKTKTKQILEELKEKLQKLQVIKLTLAFDPTEKMMQNICQWVKKNLRDGIILEIEKDKSILGGAIVVYQGLYKDYSLSKALDEELIKQKMEIITLVTKASTK